MEKRGVEYISQDPEIQTKIKRTNLEKYGNEWGLGSTIIKEKGKKTVWEKYGVEHITQVPKVKDKIKETNLKKYGVEHPMQSDTVKQKTRNTMKQKFGDTMPFNRPEVRLKGIETKSKKAKERNEQFKKEILEVRSKFVDDNWLCIVADITGKTLSATKTWIKVHMKDFYREIKDSLRS